MPDIKQLALKFHVGTLWGMIAFVAVATWVVSSTFTNMNHEMKLLETKYEYSKNFSENNEENIAATQLVFATSNKEIMMELRGIRESIVKINTILKIKEEVKS